jgi:type I restriction enzyme, S subunit
VDGPHSPKSNPRRTTRGVIRQADLLASSSKKDSSNLDKSKYKLVEPGDLAYNKMRAWQGAIGLSAYRGIVSPAYVVQRLRGEGLPRYFHYLFRTPAFATEAERWSYGITSDQWSLRPEHFKMIYSCVPPVDEQVAVARYADDLDRRINRVIAQKRRLVTLLREQEVAEVTRAVTMGVHPPERTRPCDLAWLPAIPHDWEVVPLKRHWTVTDCKHLTVPFVDEGIPLASVREAQTFDIDLTRANRTTPEWYGKLVEGGRRPTRGDIIYCRNVSVGASAYADTDEQFAMGQDVCLIRSRFQNNRYLNYLLHSGFMSRQLASFQIGSTFSRINVADVKALVVLVPPRDEQDRIVEHLDAIRRTFREPIARTLLEVELIREYRTRVVTDVVTGKLDVREAAAALPDGASDEVADPRDELDDDEDLAEVDLEEFDEVTA